MGEPAVSQMLQQRRFAFYSIVLLFATIATSVAGSMARAAEPAQPVDHKMSSGLMLGRTTSSDYSGMYTGTAESKDTAGGLFYEYDFTKNVGVQTSAWWLASHDSADVTQGSKTYTGVTRNVTGFALDFVGLLPLGRGFKVLGKAGAFFWSGEINGCGDFLCNSFAGTSLEDGNGVSFKWGAAIRWDFSDRLGVRVDYDDFGRVFNADMRTISIGVYSLFY